MNLKQHTRAKAARHALAIGLWSLLFAAVTSLLSQTGVERIDIFAAGLALLLLIILVGIVFDIVGVAATVAQPAPLHARAAHRVFGAAHALHLIRNAHRVASFCNDVVGDISGTLSGAIGVTLVLKLLHAPGDTARIVGTTVMTACIAALVIGGKAYGKVFALHHGTEIMFRVGRFVGVMDRILRLRLLPPPGRKRPAPR
ncbi:MAG: hypothetical protein JW951_04670 [Lentisphaerae bacterium]|nr:hypothetical protein [Lentisphaerota bacterium]